jgi:DNA-binding response OmpR family regulator
MTSKRKKVLIVDDETFILELIRDFLELKNIDSDMAKDPMTALKLLKKNQYELLLVDKNLQDSQGESLILEMKKLKTKMPIILLTGDLSLSDEYINKIGVNDVIFKPFQVEEFYEKISQYLVI